MKLSNLNNLYKIEDFTNDMKIEYFSLGKALFYIKLGKKIFEESKEQFLDVLLRKIDKENKYKIIDRDLIYLLIKLLKCDITFEQIYRNKWLNKNLDYIEDSLCNFEIDEEKLIIELQKQDFIIKKNKIIKYYTRVINENLLINNNRKKGKKVDLRLLGKKFRFKKSSKINK